MGFFIGCTAELVANKSNLAWKGQFKFTEEGRNAVTQRDPKLVCVYFSSHNFIHSSHWFEKLELGEGCRHEFKSDNLDKGAKINLEIVLRGGSNLEEIFNRFDGARISQT